MYKKILVPLDGSELAEKILPQVAALANCTQAEIVLLTVNVAPALLLGDAVPNADRAERIAAIKPHVEKKLAQTADGLRAKGLKVSTLVRESSQPTVEIINSAVDNRCDLITMATHGRGEIAWVIGSVTEKVVAHSPVPVLVMRVMNSHPLTAKQ